jgi:hypothetical protein
VVICGSTTRVKVGAALTDEDLARVDLLAAETLDAGAVEFGTFRGRRVVNIVPVA